MNAPKMVYIYGDIDPWGASGIYGLHSSRASRTSFPEPTRQEIIQLIKKWLEE